MKKSKNHKPLVCAYCKKLIDVDNQCFEFHEGQYYHADCKIK